MPRMTAAEKSDLHNKLVSNVLDSRERGRQILAARKLKAYIEYRDAREALTAHNAFTLEIRTKGIEALK